MGQKIHGVREGLKLPSVWERLSQLHGLQERQRVLQSLQNWEQIALRLKKPQVYRERIREVMIEYQQSGLLLEPTISSMRADIRAGKQLQVGKYGPSLSLQQIAGW